MLPSIKPAPKVVLVVHHDAAVRQVLKLILERSDFFVLQSGGVAEAILVKGSAAVNTDLLLTEFDLGSKTGVTLGILLRGMRPDLRVLLMYDGDAAEPPVLPDGWAIILKPFGPAELEKAVRAVLDLDQGLVGKAAPQWFRKRLMVQFPPAGDPGRG